MILQVTWEEFRAWFGVMCDSHATGKKEIKMSTGTTRVNVDTGVGLFWFMGWLFTIAFAKLIWWQAIIGMFIWPYFLGLAVR